MTGSPDETLFTNKIKKETLKQQHWRRSLKFPYFILHGTLYYNTWHPLLHFLPQILFIDSKTRPVQQWQRVERGSSSTNSYPPKYTYFLVILEQWQTFLCKATVHHTSQTTSRGCFMSVHQLSVKKTKQAEPKHVCDGSKYRNNCFYKICKLFNVHRRCTDSQTISCIFFYQYMGITNPPLGFL